MEVEGVFCKSCGGTEINIKEVKHGAGIHRRAECDYCGKFIKFLPLSDSSEFVMPFGKHKGLKLGEVPGDYLEWLVENATNMRGSMRKHIENELIHRGMR